MEEDASVEGEGPFAAFLLTSQTDSATFGGLSDDAADELADAETAAAAGEGGVGGGEEVRSSEEFVEEDASGDGEGPFAAFLFVFFFGMTIAGFG